MSKTTHFWNLEGVVFINYIKETVKSSSTNVHLLKTYLWRLGLDNVSGAFFELCALVFFPEPRESVARDLSVL